MFIRKLYMVVGLVLVLGFFFEIMAHAEDTTQEIAIHIQCTGSNSGTGAGSRNLSLQAWRV